MITVKHIDTIDGIKDLIFVQTYNAAIDRTRSSYFYRGMRNVAYDLTTSLSRNCKDAYAELEQPMLDSFMNYVHLEDLGISQSVWKAMVIGQHYGLPTRLLDWTHSTLVALHFATLEENLDKLGQRDCAVWRIDLRDLNRNLPPRYQQYLETKDKAYWYDMIQLLPSSYNQMRTVTLNYENLINIYYARRNHKLAEWHTLCDWIMSLPYAKEFIAVKE